MTDLQFAPAMVTARKTRGGGLVIESPVPLGGYETQVGQMLRRWAGLTPHNPFLAERNRDGQWVRLCYSEAADRADRISQALLDRELSLERPVMVFRVTALNMLYCRSARCRWAYRWCRYRQPIRC
ncbi:MAG: hypothetical protein Ct9H300mP16_12960 [Pseudomonadota bacterium]|nr:MAG: hypothetical protein Ct9H300mP16_12960 [Pseudomonadota bacterium]